VSNDVANDVTNHMTGAVPREVTRRLTRLLLLLCVTFAGPFAWPQTLPAKLENEKSRDVESDEAVHLLVGFTQAAAAGARPAQHMFADFFFSMPLPAERLGLWGDIRLASMPRQINSTVLTLPSDVAYATISVPLNQIAQSGEFVTGVQFDVAGGRAWKGSLPKSSVDTNATTMVPTKANEPVTVSTHDLSNDARDLAPATNAAMSGRSTGPPPTQSRSVPTYSKTRVALIAGYGASAPISYRPGQNRFYRQYWGGLRFARTNSTQHVLDMTVGQNEAITGGTLHGPVLRFSTEYGLVATKIGTAHLVGEAQLALTQNPAHADLFRVGVGFNFLQILKASGSN
jgi:hypothetical protein